MKKHLLKTMLLSTLMVLGGVASAWADTGSAVVKTTVVDYDQPDAAAGEVAADETIVVGYNKISGNSVAFANTGWGVNKIGYLQVDASAINGTITGATLTMEVSGSTDNKRTTGWGVGYNDSEWSSSLTYNTADKSITKVGDEVWTTTKIASTFETKEFNITDALKNDADKVVTIVVYELAAAGGNMKNPKVSIEYISADAQTAQYTVKYLSGSVEVKDAVQRTGVVGEKVTLDAADKENVVKDGQKYIYTDDNAATTTIADDGSSVVTVNFREAATYNWTVNSNIGQVAKGTGFEGETIAAGYPRYGLFENVFYEAPVNNKEYRVSIALTADNATANVTYAEKEGISNVVFYAEGENISGLTETAEGNLPVRGSNAKGGKATDDVKITTLPAGKYILHVGTFTTKSGEQKIYVGYGETQLAFASSINLSETASDEITLNEATDLIYFGTTSSADAQLDYIYVEKTGDVEVATPAEVTFDFNANEWNHALGYGSGATAEAGNITEPIVKDGVTLTFDKAGASTPARFWTGPQVRIYKDSELTVAAPDGKAITKVEFTANGNNFGLTANPEGLEGATWTGNATSVVFTPTKTNQLTKIVVTLADKNSETTEPVVATIPEVDNIAAFIALESGTEATLKLTNAKVTYAGTSDIVIEDATGAIDLYKIGLTAATNQVLNGTLTGKNSPFQGMPEMAKTGNTDVATVTVTDGEVIEGKAVTVAEAQTADNLLRLVTLTGVEIVAVTEGEEDNAKTTYYAKSGDDQIQIYNKFKADYTIADGDKLAKLTGIIVPYVSGETTIYELAPRTQEDIVAAEQEPETEMITGIADFQELCMKLGKGGPWAVNDGGDAGFTIGNAVMHYLGDYAEQGDAFVWGKRFAYEFVDGRGKFTMRNKNNKKDTNCGMFSWDFAHNFSILGLENGDKVTINIGTGTVTFVSTNVSGEVEAGSNVTSGKTYTIVAADGETTRLDINMAKASLIASITIEKAGQETVPNITDVKPTLALIPGATYKLAANITPADAKLQWKSSDEAVATVTADGTVTAVAAGTATITAFWKSEISDATTDAKCEVTVAAVDLENAYVATTTYDFAAMADTELTIASEAAGAIWNAANNKNNNVFFCTNDGLENIAVQAVLNGNKGWSIVNGKGLALAAGAGRCAAVGGIKQGQIVEFFYTGDAFYTSNADDGVAKKTLNEGIGHAIYQAEADGMIGFEIVVDNAVSKVVVYTDIETAINSVENKNAAAKQSDAIYNLNGQKVEKAQKGLYIIGGKKVIVK